MASVLTEIADHHRLQWRDDERSVSELSAGLDQAPPARDFRGALTASGLSVIAEVKRRSPSVGNIDIDLDPADLARRYESGGASCLSVLTDERYFGGSIADLRAARGSVDVPVLRKDFTVDERDVLVARSMGADAVLLIVAVLSDAELTRFQTLAAEVGLAALVEVHDELEVRRAVASGASIIGVNQRNLADFSIDRGLAVRVRSHIPEGVVSVAESGIRDASDAQSLADVGFDAVLVGTSVISSSSPADAIAAMAGL